MKTEFYKEKIRADTELLKLFFSALLVLFGIIGTLLLKDNLGESQTHLFVAIVVFMMILVFGSICFSLKDNIDKNLTKLKENDNA